jgi:hypothetical protein
MIGPSGRSARRFARALLPALVFMAVPAAAGISWHVSGDSLSGPRDYKESALEGGVSIPMEEAGVLDRLDFSLNRTAYGVKDSTAPTVTWTLNGDVSFQNKMGAGLSLWTTPAPQELRQGSYRASGADLSGRMRWDGFWPFWKPAAPSFLETEPEAFLGLSKQEEYFVIPLPLRTIRRWGSVDQSYFGGSMTETFWGGFRLGGEGRRYAYNKDLGALSDRLEFLSLSDAGTAASFDQMLGFPRASWGFRAGQALWSWGDLSASWKRTSYLIGRASRSDTTSAELSLSPWHMLTLRFRYEVSRPRGRAADEYKGLGLETGL